MPRSNPLTVTLGTSRASACARSATPTSTVVAASPGAGTPSIAGRALGRAAAVDSPEDLGIGRSVAVTTDVATARRWVALVRIVARNGESHVLRGDRRVETAL